MTIASTPLCDVSSWAPARGAASVPRPSACCSAPVSLHARSAAPSPYRASLEPLAAKATRRALSDGARFGIRSIDTMGRPGIRARYFFSARAPHGGTGPAGTPRVPSQSLSPRSRGFGSAGQPMAPAWLREAPESWRRGTVLDRPSAGVMPSARPALVPKGMPNGRQWPRAAVSSMVQ